MFNKKTDQNEGPLLTVMGVSAHFEGKFNITESIQIECEVAGEINVDGKLVIGDRGVVKADVHTTDAIIMGQYEGNMVATGNVEIAASGRVSGNIDVPPQSRYGIIWHDPCFIHRIEGERLCSTKKPTRMRAHCSPSWA